MHFLKRTLRRLLGGTEALLSRMYGWKWNPMHQAGTVSALMLLVLVATGLYLVMVYRVGDPAASVARIAADPWLGSWIRSLHRYATDIFVIAAVVHALKMFSQDRSWGPRTLAWISGLVLFGIGMVLAVTGFVMAWDSFGERLAREGGRLLDFLPIFSEPLSRIFAGGRSIASRLNHPNRFHCRVVVANFREAVARDGVESGTRRRYYRSVDPTSHAPPAHRKLGAKCGRSALVHGLQSVSAGLPVGSHYDGRAHR